jgi:hypothetical protein
MSMQIVDATITSPISALQPPERSLPGMLAPASVRVAGILDAGVQA